MRSAEAPARPLIRDEPTSNRDRGIVDQQVSTLTSRGGAPTVAGLNYACPAYPRANGWSEPPAD